MKDIGYGLLTIVYFAGAAAAVALLHSWRSGPWRTWPTGSDEPCLGGHPDGRHASDDGAQRRLARVLPPDRVSPLRRPGGRRALPVSRVRIAPVKIPYVMVRWIDTQAGPGWKSRAAAQDWANAKGAVHLSVGFRLPIGPKGDVVLASSVQLASNGSVGELLQIPREAVKSIKILGRIDH